MFFALQGGQLGEKYNNINTRCKYQGRGLWFLAFCGEAGQGADAGFNPRQPLLDAQKKGDQSGGEAEVKAKYFKGDGHSEIVIL